MEFVIETLQADWEDLLRFAPKLLYALVLLAVFFVVGNITGRLTARLLRRSERFRVNEHFLQRAVSWSIGITGILLALGLMGFQGVATSMLATGGVVAIVVGFAFREIGENFLAGFFLTFSRPFEIGDLIKTGELTGTVQSIEIRYVHVRTFDACDVFVPSSQIFREPLYNYTRDGLRRPSFTVGVAYDDEPERVMELLEKVTSAVPDVLSDPRAFVTINEFASQYIEYKVFFWIDQNESEHGYVATTNGVKASCWHALRQAGMTFSTDVRSSVELWRVPQIDVTISAQE